MTAHNRPIAAIDVGSNSMYCMVARANPSGIGAVLARSKFRARLGASASDEGGFSAATIDAAIDALRGFRALADRHDAEVIAAATAAVRGAANGDELLRRARDEANVDLRLYDGEAEAHTMYRGVRFGGVVGDRRMLCIDVGGGSTELVLGAGDAIDACLSVPVGAVSLTAAFLQRERVTPADIAAVRGAIAAALGPNITPFRDQNALAVATAGSIQRIGRVVAADREHARLDGMRVTTADVAQVAEQLAASPSHAARRAIAGMDPQRADVLLAATLIFATLGERLGVRQWIVSMAGLRAGLVATVVARRAAQAVSA